MSLRSLVLALALVSVPTIAAADPDDVDPRVGLFGGFGIHAGNMSCSGKNCNTFRKAGGADVHIGWGFNDKLALIGDIYVLTSKEDNLSITQTLATIGVRYWVVPIFWVQGGLGGASAQFSYDAGILGTYNAHSDNAAAATVAAGFEVVKGRRFALDIEARLGYGFYPGNSTTNEPDDTGRSTSLGVGFTWF